ncbi:histidine kinase [Pedosphaera parvula Ellin514]|uniref:Histidine kinase n=2 Tax=Pedosphaera TaxID=1032526 RepID=B9XAU9_PEDPL|nr:histidine kinase [Pedosphaera parvula Ellin514]
MPRYSFSQTLGGWLYLAPSRQRGFAKILSSWQLLIRMALGFAVPARAAILWSDLGATLAHESGVGDDILGGAVKRSNSSSDALYFKFHIDPLSDVATEEYFAAFQLFAGDKEGLAVGNSLKAWGYSAFNAAQTGESNKVFGDCDLHSSRLEASGAVGTFLPYELPRRGIENTIVFKVQYVPGSNDLVTVWMNPDLGPGASEASQLASSTTFLQADASFDQIHLRHGGGGGGWTFSDMAIATSFSDFVTASGIESEAAPFDTPHDMLPFSFRSWQREQGLPQNSVRALAQTRDGYIWVGSDGGVARFDGLRFVSFGLREGLGSGPVRTLFGDTRGTLWIGSAGGGLTSYRDGQFTTFTIRDGLPADSITALAEDSQGRLWVGTEAGLVLWQDNRPVSLSGIEEFKGRAVTTLFKDRHGTMWLGARGVGIFRLLNGQLAHYSDPSMESLLQDPHCLLVDRAGRVWIGVGDDLVLCQDGDQWRRYRIPRHLTRPYVSALAEEPDGTVWAGSVSEGLFRFKDGKLTTVTASSGLSDNLVESLLIDREGKLWVGTGAGLNRLRTKKFSSFGPGEGLGYGAVQGLAEVAPGVIWAGKPGDGLYRWEGRNFSRITPAGLPRKDPQANSLLLAGDGSCWVGGEQGLVHFKKPNLPAEAAGPPALAKLNISALAEDGSGGVWVGTHEGELWHQIKGRWLPQTNLILGHAITAIVPDKKGLTWIATEGEGLYQYSTLVQAHYDKSSGLLSDFIRTLYLDAEGALWIGTAGGGLSRMRNGITATFTTREGLSENTISQILEDDEGRLWLGGNRGIAAVSKHELDELAAGKISAVYPQAYGRAEGMLSEECTGGFFPAGLKTKSGLLWFSTSKGIVVVDPRPRPTGSPSPSTVIEEVLLDGVVGAEFRSSVHGVDGGAGNSREKEQEILRIPPGKHRLELRYTGLSFNAPERVRFRYRLAGLDPDWMDAGTRRTAFYSYVPPGDYSFRVKACNSDGVWDATGAGLGLKVSPHFWQTWWFMGISAIGLLGAVGGVARVAEKRKLQRRLANLEQERTLQRERERIAQDLHDDLGSSLARISLLSGLAKADKDHPIQLETHVNKIAQSANETVKALEEIVWAVRPDSDSLQSLVEYIAHFANELFEDGNARCRLDLPHNLPTVPMPPEVRHNIFLVVKEVLTNSFKHACAKEIRVRAKASSNSLEIVMQDDGKGFDVAALSGLEKRNGLTNMRQRTLSVGGNLAVKSEIGKGTMVTLSVNCRPETVTKIIRE